MEIFKILEAISGSENSSITIIIIIIIIDTEVLSLRKKILDIKSQVQFPPYERPNLVGKPRYTYWFQSTDEVNLPM